MDGIFATDSREQSKQQSIIESQIIIDEFSKQRYKFHIHSWKTSKETWKEQNIKRNNKF